LNDVKLTSFILSNKRC